MIIQKVSLVSIIELLVLFLVSLVANLLSALAGGGAGLLQLPALLHLGLPFAVALATHKIASVALGVGATLRHWQNGQFNWRFSAYILIAGLPGVWLGTHTAGMTVRSKRFRSGHPTPAEFVKFATPTVCGNYNRKGASNTSGDGLATQVGGRLNPMWVEWLMSWPLGWTDCDVSATDKFRSWQQQHGVDSLS